MIKLSIIALLIILILVLIYIIVKKTYNINNMPITLEKVYELEKKSRKIYKKVKLTNLFKDIPKQEGLRFGYICPGAMKTVDFLNNYLKKDNKSNKELKKLVKQIQLLTDFLFFVEIYQIYREYIDEEVVKEMKSIIKNNGCKISKIITDEISSLFAKLPDNLSKNLPDNFYHIRHNTLICSNDKVLAQSRIDLLKSIYGTKEDFNTQYHACIGKRNGVSGCRDCCNAHFSNNVSTCINTCMEF